MTEQPNPLLIDVFLHESGINEHVFKYLITHFQMRIGMAFYRLFNINCQTPTAKNVAENKNLVDCNLQEIDGYNFAEKYPLTYETYKEQVSEKIQHLAKKKMEIIEKELIEKSWHPSRLAWVGELGDE